MTMPPNSASFSVTKYDVEAVGDSRRVAHLGRLGGPWRAAVRAQAQAGDVGSCLQLLRLAARQDRPGAQPVHHTGSPQYTGYLYSTAPEIGYLYSTVLEVRNLGCRRYTWMLGVYIGLSHCGMDQSPSSKGSQSSSTTGCRDGCQDTPVRFAESRWWFCQ